MAEAKNADWTIAVAIYAGSAKAPVMAKSPGVDIANGNA